MRRRGRCLSTFKPSAMCQEPIGRPWRPTNWKLLDALKANGTDKNGLSQSDIDQLQAYGQSDLPGGGMSS
jgi:hypothetical protein